MASILCFLARLTVKHADQDLHSHPLYCNNQGLVDQVITIAKFPTIFPNTIMEAERDCIVQILASLKTPGQVAPLIHHVKGHQDHDTPYEQLALKAQLNCNADTYAAKYTRDNPDPELSKAHLFPAGECVLDLQHGTITCNLKEELPKAGNLPTFWEKNQTNAGWWDIDMFDHITWEAHGQALQQHAKHWPTFVKNIHQILPLGKRVHCYDPKYPLNCLTCNSLEEDMEHFWKCRHSKWIEWHRNFFSRSWTNIW